MKRTRIMRIALILLAAALLALAGCGSGSKSGELIIKPGDINVPSYAYANRTDIITAVIPDTIRIIADYAFSECRSLTSVTIPDTVTKIGAGAFSGCTSLASVTIPDSVTEIGTGAFAGCASLTSISIPDSVASLGINAFGHCEKLEEASVPGHLTQAGSFTKSPNLKTVRVTGSVVKEGFARQFERLTGPVIVEDTVTEIERLAFADCGFLTSVTIPDSVTEIGTGAFSGCTSLASVTIPGSVTRIGESVFAGCSSLSSVTIPDSVASIGSYAFSGCAALTSVVIPDSVSVIGTDAFNGCEALETVTLPGGAACRGFDGCPNLREIRLTGDEFNSSLLTRLAGLPALESVVRVGGTQEVQSAVVLFEKDSLSLTENTPVSLGLICFGTPRELTYSVEGNSVTVESRGEDGVKITPVRDGEAIVSVRDADGPVGICTVRVLLHHDLADLIASGDVSVTLSCSGIQSGKVQIRNNTDRKIAFYAPPGTYMMAGGSGYQNMMIMTEIRGTLSANASEKIDVDTCCMNIHRDIPTEDKSFSLSKSEDEVLCALAAYCQQNSVSYKVRQAATWILTDDASYEACGTLVNAGGARVITRENYNEAASLLESIRERLNENGKSADEP